MKILNIENIGIWYIPSFNKIMCNKLHGGHDEQYVWDVKFTVLLKPLTIEQNCLLQLRGSDNTSKEQTLNKWTNYMHLTKFYIQTHYNLNKLWNIYQYV